MLVKSLNQDSLTFRVDISTTTVASLQRLIAEEPKLGVPVDRQRLIHAGKSLDNEGEQLLAALGLEDDSIIHLCQRVAGQLPVRFISQDHGDMRVVRLCLERQTPVGEVKSRLCIPNSQRHFYYIYSAPHPLIISEARIRRLGAQFAWPALALFGTRLRDWDDGTFPSARSTSHRFITKAENVFILLHLRPPRSRTLANYGVEKQATLYLITRRQIVDATFSWTLILATSFGVGWLGYSYSIPAVRAGWSVFRVICAPVVSVWTMFSDRPFGAYLCESVGFVRVIIGNVVGLLVSLCLLTQRCSSQLAASTRSVLSHIYTAFERAWEARRGVNENPDSVPFMPPWFVGQLYATLAFFLRLFVACLVFVMTEILFKLSGVYRT